MSVDGDAPPIDDGAVRLRRTAATVLAAALVVAVACAPALAKPGKLLGKGTDNGFPIAYANGLARDPKALLVRITATPRQPVEVLWQVTCRRGGKKAKVPAGDYTTTSNKLKKLKMGTKSPDDCTVDVQAAYVTADVSGFIKIELFARPRR